ncbi:MAG: hypothetical protein GX643_08705 [Acidimicrobiales bacterium]|nr:hypothetical protein [Acidimicrobiales bacterium]
MTVLVPAGLPLVEAARWVGGSCWLELHAHAVITDALADLSLEDPQRIALWTVRSNRAEMAEAWHRRLPELREFPRETFVSRPDGVGADTPDGVLAQLHRRYAEHEAVAVGPADGPVAQTLARAGELIARDLAAVAG